MKKQLTIFSGFLILYGLLLWRLGYIFGSNDQSEMLPYAQYLADPTLYPSDFYVQSITAHWPNERFVFSAFLSWFIPILQPFTLALHALFTLILMAGFYRLAAKSLYTEGGRLVALALATVVLYDWNTGGNELYYNSFVPSYLAQALIIWVLVLCIEKKYIVAYLLTLIAGLFHPLAGIQTTVLLLGAQIATAWQHKARFFEGKMAWYAASLVVLMGIYVAGIKAQYDATTSSAHSFFEILEFRAAHHYFPHYFSKKGFLLLPVWAFFGWLYGQTFTRHYILFILAGIPVYLIGVYGLENVSILSTQWFKTTVWVKTLGCIGLCTFIERRCLASRWAALLSPRWVQTFLVLGGVVMVLLWVKWPKRGDNYRLDISAARLAADPSVDIALQAKSKTTPESVFLIPAELSTFRYFSQRNVYIDYKATNHRQQAFKVWYDRIQAIYAINIDQRRTDPNMLQRADSSYTALSSDTLKAWSKEKAIAYIVAYKTTILPFPLIAENQRYRIYYIN